MIRRKGVPKEGFYANVRGVDLHGRCLVRHHGGFHLLLARLEPVECPYAESCVDIRDKPVRRLAMPWTLCAKSCLVGEAVTTPCLLVPPGKSLRSAWVRRERIQPAHGGTQAVAAFELLTAMRMVWNILQAHPSHTAQLRLFTPKSALLFLGGCACTAPDSCSTASTHAQSHSPAGWVPGLGGTPNLSCATGGGGTGT